MKIQIRRSGPGAENISPPPPPKARVSLALCYHSASHSAFLVLGLLEHTAVGDRDGGAGLAVASAVPLNLLDELVVLEHLAKDDVLAVEPIAGDGGHEELGAVGVAASVGHREEAGGDVAAGLAGETLILELVAVDGAAAGAVALREVAALQHKVRNDAVEDGSLEVEGLAVGGVAGAAAAELAEVAGGDRNSVVEELELNAASGAGTAHKPRIAVGDGDVKEDLRVLSLGRVGGDVRRRGGGGGRGGGGDAVGNGTADDTGGGKGAEAESHCGGGVAERKGEKIRSI